MKSTYVKIVLFVLLVGLLAACGSSPTEAPAAPSTDTASPATEAPTDVPPVTTAATEPPAATEVPATQPAAGGATVSFANDILPLIQSRCIGCHGGDRTEEGLDMNTHASLMAGSEDGPVVTPGDAANSLLVEMVATQKMPKRGPKLTPPQVQLITDWVNQGALDN
ncbi:MAG TPA: c-type cytochrome domain-containing protein [Anaerolineales bacterium]|nr:c-type cytochrome domain-containing protein [Anaerolineales bacterium]